MVLADRDVDGLGGGGRCDPRELGERSGRHDRLRVAAGSGQRGLLHREPIGVRRRHRDRALAELDEDAGQHGTRLVLGRSSRDVVDRRHERSAIDRERRSGCLGKVGEVLGALRVERVLARAAGQLHRSAPGGLLQRHRLLGEGSDNFEQEPPSENRRTRFGDLGLKTRADRELHVGRGQLHRAAGLGADQDPREDLNGRALGHPAGHDLEAVQQVFLRTDDLHAEKLLGATNITEFFKKERL